jgi:hypothetical protein
MGRSTISCFEKQIVKSLGNKSIESARPRAVYSPHEPKRANRKSGPRAGRLHAEGYLEMYLSP